VDEETASLIDELRHPGAALLLALLERDQTEDDLRRCAPDLSQSAVNRKLQRLAEKRLIQRETGSKQQKGLLWGLAFRVETGDLLVAANELARLSVERRAEQVAETSRGLRQRRDRRHLRDASDGTR
jgi:DNA-binding HxlR family transcriptional regulator